MSIAITLIQRQITQWYWLCAYVSKATYYKKYIRKSNQTMYYISKSTFKLIKPLEIYDVQHYEIVLFSFSWIQINLSRTHKYKQINDKPMNRDQSART